MLKLKFLACAAIISAGIFSSTAMAAQYSDLPQNHWAYNDIQKAGEIGFMSGMGDGTFGIGKNVKRSEFVSMLSRVFGWENVQGTNSFADVSSDKWYYGAVEAAVKNDVITTDTDYFRPEENITREEMAVMIVRALGYSSIVSECEKLSVPFTDITENKGYIVMAYDMGIISGKSDTSFDPKGTALRQEAAAMLVRCYEKYNSSVDFIHGFYAFSSYSQKDMAAQMDAVSFGWSKMEYSDETGVTLNTLSNNNNEWVVPSGYEDIVQYLKSNNVKTNLNVFMSAYGTDDVSKLLSSAQNRTAAVDAIIAELTSSYKQLGYNPYDGVTIDFENLRADLKENYVSFLSELKGRLDQINKSLYVAVQPNLKSGAYYDGYDFKQIGNIADKVILMAYDYQPSSISQSVMESGFTTTPVTPFDEVYYALRTITDKNTGVQDRSKVVLGLSIADVGWNVSNGQITNSKGNTYSYSEINDIINSGGNVTYSEKYRNPYVVFDENGGTTTIWYEDARSVRDKIMLARMFDVTGVSVWRLGLIPDYSGNNLDIWGSIKALEK